MGSSEISPYREAGVAAVYSSLAGPIQFDAPARDLVELVGIAEGARVLDVGAGTGAVTVPAAAAAGRRGLTVGVDASSTMLQQLRAKGPYRAVVAQALYLPFAPRVFDAVLAGFVVSHFPDYAQALTELVRVLRPGGRLGLSAWDMTPNPPARLWRDVAGRFANLTDLSEAFRAVIPWDEFFSDPTNLLRTLEHAGLTNVELTRREYNQSAATSDFLALREAAVEGTVLRRLLRNDWEPFRREVRVVFGREFPDRVEYRRAAHLAVATKPH